jgi:hypothetical protein
MAFVLGSGCTEDPLLPWLRRILDDPSITDPAERVNTVCIQAMDTLRKWWG